MINPLNINTKPPSLGVFFLWNFIVLLGVSYNFRLFAIGSLKKYNKKNIVTGIKDCISILFKFNFYYFFQF
jgi:hypothetical protein